MSDAFSFRLIARDGAARLGEITTPHGRIATPAFMPVGTQAAMKAVLWRDVRESGAEIVLGNTYHLMLRPGAERIAALGGLHTFSGWNGPILTDSGGFQVMSLAPLRSVDEKAVTFRSHIDGATVVLTPERAIEIQRLLGSDIAMQLDECIALPASPEDISRVLGLGDNNEPLAVQGGDIDRLRIESARALVGIGFHGYAIGGLAVGEPQAVMLRVIGEVAPHLPDDRPRYLMGVGTPDDLLESVARGMDMFDCVMPTRNGRHGMAFTRFSAINLRNARHGDDPRPLDEQSRCPAARDFSRAYLHHLVRANETLGAMLLSMVNLYYYQDLMRGIRAAVAERRFGDFCAETRAGWAAGDLPPL